MITKKQLYLTGICAFILTIVNVGAAIVSLRINEGTATDNALVRFDGTGGVLMQRSTTTLSDAGLLTLPAGGTIAADLTTSDDGFINFQGTADADATSAISTLNTSGATTDHIQIEINGTTAWIAVSTTDSS